MFDNYYPISSDDFLTFEFKSIGPMGVITKVVSYTRIGSEKLYNLGFGDKNEETGSVSDLTVSNNHDSRKVLTTVSKTLYLFTEKHLEATVFAIGSTEARTRLYQMGISGNLEAVEKDFDILGFTDGAWQIFRRNITYHAFFGKKKKSSFVDMKTKEVKNKKKVISGIAFTINPELNGKYDNDPFFKEKAKRAEEFIKKAGIPKF